MTKLNAPMREYILPLLIGTLCAVVCALAILSSSNIARADTLCVKPGGGDGCFDSINTALAGAQISDTIRVATGTYTENVQITKTVVLEGGWDLTFTQRDPELFVTTIRPADPDVAVVTAQGDSNDWSAVAPTIDGFTITGGRSSNHGGGLRMNDSNAIVSHNIITDNVGYLFGGGVWVQRGAPLFENNRIENNTCDGPGQSAQGGGIQLENTQAILTGNIIANNRVVATNGFGGGLSAQGGGPVVISNNTIAANSISVTVPLDPPSPPEKGGASPGAASFEPLGGLDGRGGGVALLDITATLDLNLIQDNIAAEAHNGYGGGVFIGGSVVALNGNTIQNNIASIDTMNNGRGYGGGVRISNFSEVTGKDDTLRGNTAGGHMDSGDGGGLHAFRSRVSLDGARFLDNNAYKGGGLFLPQNIFTITNSLVANNSAADFGGMLASDGPGTLVNNTFVNNGDIGIYTLSPLTLTNSIIMSHTYGISATTATTVTAGYNDFWANSVNAQGFTLDPTNLIVNPHLTADYHLAGGSPVIDMGTRTGAPKVDIDGEPRPMRVAGSLFKFDIGADEWPGVPQINRYLGLDPADFTLIGPGNPQDNPDSTGPSDWIGFAVMGGDADGDGRDDLFAGAPNWSDDFDNVVTDSGRVFGLYNNGARRLGVTDLYTTTASLEVRSWIHQQHIGQAFDSADLDGDGVNDLIIGSGGGPMAQYTGTVYVFAGGPGLSGTRTLSPTMQADWRFKPGEQTGDFSGPGGQAAGQLDGAGPDDLAVADGLATGPGNRTGAGAVYVFFGSSSLPPVWDLGTMPASLSVYGPAIDANLDGSTVADVDGDGELDLMARTRNTIYLFYGPMPSGTIDLATTPADATITNAANGFLEAGDINGDGKADLLISGGGEVNVVLGGTLPATQTLDEATWARFTGVSTGVATPALWTADWNDDGKAEVLIGERYNERVLVVYGSNGLQGTANIVDRADWIIYGELVNVPLETDQFGYSLGSGDLDDDGVADLILGSRDHDVDNHPADFDDAGAIYVLYGAPGQPGGTPTPTVVAGTTTATPVTPLPTATVCPIQFTDVAEGSTFYPFVRCLACLGILGGYSDGTFRPANNVTRGQLAKIVSNAAGFSDPAGTQIFEDVAPGSTFYDFVQRLASRGYMSGYACGGVGEPCGAGNLPYFRSNSNATRGQISKIVSNAAGFSDPPGAQTFEDVVPGSTFYDFVQRLGGRGVMTGYACGGPGEVCNPPGNLAYFRPQSNATRGQTSKIVSNTFFPSCNMRYGD